MSLKVQKITATAMGTGTTQVLDVECAEMDCLVVQADLNGAAITDLKVDVQPYEEGGTTLMAAGVFISPTRMAGPVLSGGKVQQVGWYDVSGVWKVRVTVTNRNAGTQTLNMFSARCEHNPPQVRPVAYIGEPIMTQGTAAAPGAAANVVNLAAASIPAGWYRIKVTYNITGALETAAFNLRVKRNAGNFKDLLTATAIGTVIQEVFDRVWLDGTNAFQVAAVAAAAASTVYNVGVELQRVE